MFYFSTGYLNSKNFNINKISRYSKKQEDVPLAKEAPVSFNVNQFYQICCELQKEEKTVCVG